MAQITVPVAVAGFNAASASFVAEDGALRTFVFTSTVANEAADIYGSADGTNFQYYFTLNTQSKPTVINDRCLKYKAKVKNDGGGTRTCVVQTAVAPPFGVAWVEGGNSFGATGVLGTNDAFDMTLIAKGVEFLRADGASVNITAPGPAGFLALQAVDGDAELSAGGTGNVNIGTTGTGNVTVSSGGDVTIAPAAGQDLNLGTTGAGITAALGNNLGGTRTVVNGGTGGVGLAAAGAGDVSFTPGATGGVALAPRGVGAGDTAPLRFYELAAGGANFVGFKAPDALVGDTTYVLPTAFPTVANMSLTSNLTGTMSWQNAIQSGGADLTNGVSAAIAANITASTRIFCQAADVVPGAGDLTIDYRPLAADRVNGLPGSFKITAVLAAGTINGLDQSQGIQWMTLNG